MIVRSPLAYVRLAEGGTVALREGATVPAEADPKHVEHLTAAGVLGEGEQTDVAEVTPAPPSEPTPARGRGGRARAGEQGEPTP